MSAARRFAVKGCVSLGWGGVADTVALLVSEVVTNALLHTSGRDVCLRVCERDGRLRVEVDDGGRGRPVARDAGPGAENGRGLVLVAALASGWGYDLRADGKTAWFEIDA